MAKKPPVNFRGIEIPPTKPTNREGHRHQRKGHHGRDQDGDPPDLRRVLDAWARVLGLELKTLSTHLRSEYRIKDSVNGVVITGVDATAAARLSAGDVIVQVRAGHRWNPVTSAADVRKLIGQQKKDRMRALVLVSNADGDERIVDADPAHTAALRLARA